MKRLFGLFSLKKKLFLAFLSILILSTFPLVPALWIASKTINEHVLTLINNLQNQELRINDFIFEEYKENNFQETGKSDAIDRFKTNQVEAKKIISDFANQNLTDQENSITKEISNSLEELDATFDSLIVLLKIRGFKDYGLEGTLRKAIHEVENSGLDFDEAALLTLRRNEKDFFLRKDLKYIKDFDTNFNVFKAKIEAVKELRESIVSARLEEYNNGLKAIVEVENKIGLNSTEGLLGKINKNFSAIWPQVEWLAESIRNRNQQEIDRLKLSIYILFSFQFIMGVLLGIYYSALLAKPVMEIKKAIEDLANGIFPEKLEANGQDEIGKSKRALNHFLDRLTASTYFAQTLGEGNLQATYREEFKNDVMAQSLMIMQQKLNAAELKQRETIWSMKGMASFGESIKDESKDLTVLGQEMLVTIAKHLNAQQGALFIYNKENICRFATFACENIKQAQNCFEIGEGYIGQCFKDNATLLLDRLPNSFINISSGLGKSAPVQVILVPIKTNQEVLGVMEIATFYEIKNFQREFLEKIAERIAYVLMTKRGLS